ncbi:hypothetical protein H2509_03230 [Stappia sp. F7233]|uniref:Uncharacterized protein n=1 Tax=Stappia albiluteola TaxID=2758565 RepID=A0A839A9B9_9HYPH|nr:hypothetical protein [Stappia albiluteola]MBA5776133.1 hypothetical protein [Stappia albiluteola]
MKLNNFLLISGLIVSGLQSPVSPAAQEVHQSYALSEVQVSAIHEGVRDILKDPESARFGEILAAANGEGAVSACGWVNAKNSYGGYTGDKPFIGLLINGRFVAVFIGDTDADPAVILSLCAENGIKL